MKSRTVRLSVLACGIALIGAAVGWLVGQDRWDSAVSEADSPVDLVLLAMLFEKGGRGLFSAAYACVGAAAGLLAVALPLALFEFAAIRAKQAPRNP